MSTLFKKVMLVIEFPWVSTRWRFYYASSDTQDLEGLGPYEEVISFLDLDNMAED